MRPGARSALCTWHPPPAERQLDVGDEPFAARGRATAAPAPRARSADCPGAQAQRSGQRLQQRALAGAVGAEQRDELAGAQLDAHVAEHLALAAAHAQVLAGKQHAVGRGVRWSPRRCGSASGCRCPDAGAGRDRTSGAGSARSARSRPPPHPHSAAADVVKRCARERLVVAVDVAAEDGDRRRLRTGPCPAPRSSRPSRRSSPHVMPAPAVEGGRRRAGVPAPEALAAAPEPPRPSARP